MSFGTSILTALFMMCIVFLVLVSLWFLLRVLGAIFVTLEKAKLADNKQPAQKV